VKWLFIIATLVVVGYLARPVLSPFVIGALLAYILSPVADRIQRRLQTRRVYIVAAMYIIMLSLLGVGVWALGLRVVSEVRLLSRAGPDLVDAAFIRLLGSQPIDIVGQVIDPHAVAAWTNQRLTEIAGEPVGAIHAAEKALDTVLKAFLAILVSFYLVLHGHRLDAYLLRFVPQGRRAEIAIVATSIHEVLARYLRGQLFLIGLMSTLTYLVLALGFHLPYALPIAIATGVLEVIPLLGPITAASIAAVVALVHGGTGMMIWVIVAYFVLRQAEDQLVMPIVVGRAVDLHPLVTIFAVLVGAASVGVLGALLAVPVAAALRVLVEYLYPPLPNERAVAHELAMQQAKVGESVPAPQAVPPGVKKP
jgi:predicted PurR-regulated permease PerM